MVKKLILALVLAAAFAQPRTASPGCVSDCRDDFDSEVDNCKLLYDDPEDSDDLESCIDNARSEYEDCVHECHS